MSGIPVVIAENGHGFPVRVVVDGAPVMTVAGNGLGAPVVISDRGAPFVVEGLNPPTPPVPGPLDFIEEGEGLSEIVVPYDLARPVAMLGVVFRHSGPITSMTATHGGEPLELKAFILNPDDNIGAAAFIGNGLTIEPANIRIAPVGGTIGPAAGRADDSFLIDEIEVGIAEGRFGFSNSQNGAPPVVFDPVSGDGWGVWALACSSAEKLGTAISWGAGQLQTLFWAIASSGTLQDPPAWNAPGVGWAQDGEWWTHTGAASYLSGAPLTVAMPNPFWWEVEIDVPAGDRLYVQTVGGAGYLNETFIGPVSGVVRAYRSQTYSATSFRMQALGNARFRNFRYCDNGSTIYGSFGRTVSKVPNGSSLQFQMAVVSRFAGVILEVHEKP